MNMDRPIEVSLLSTSVWLSLPQDLRKKLAKLFHLKKSGTPMTDIGPRGAVILSDGYQPTDLIPISIKKMQELLQTDTTDFYQLFDDILGSIDSLLDDTYYGFPAPIHVSGVEDIPNEIIKPGEVAILKRRGRPAKK